MQKEQIYEVLNANQVFSLATIDNGKPRVRGILLYKADENGIVFHTGKMKDLYRQILEDPTAEMCFTDAKTGMQIRISGTLEIVEGREIKDEILNHPSRAFARTWKNSGEMEEFYENFVVLCLKGGKAKTWTMQTNFEKVPEISL
ncbi:MAG: pyridoxamine 5'-phosphate oxidase family protein [Lachnospiraceae bacterium]